MNEQNSPIQAEKQNVFHRVKGFLWGYDFFISYHWASGGTYAVSLAQQLRAKNYDVFLDRVDYASGDDWKAIGEIALRNTRRLVLVATREAVLLSKPVEHEVRIFTSRGRQIIPLQFGDSFTEEERYHSFVLSKFPSTKLFIEDSRQSLSEGPSPETIKRLMQAHGVMRRRNFRAMLTLIPVIMVAAFSVFAFFSWGAALAAARIAEDRKEQAEEERDAALEAERTSRTILKVVERKAQTHVAVHEVLMEAIAVATRHLENRKNDGVEARLINRELAELYIEHAWHLDDIGQSDDAIKEYSRSLVLLEEITPNNPDDPELELRAAFIMNNIGNAYRKLEVFDKSVKQHETTLNKRRDILKRFPENFEAKRQLGVSLGSLTDSYLANGQQKEGLDMRNEAIAYDEKLWKEYPSNRWVGLNYSNGLANLGSDLAAQGELQGALDARTKAYRIRRKLFEDAKNGLPRDDGLGLFNFEVKYAKICCELAGLMAQVEPTNAQLASYFDDGISIMGRLHEDNSSNEEYKAIYDAALSAKEEWLLHK